MPPPGCGGGATGGIRHGDGGRRELALVSASSIEVCLCIDGTPSAVVGTPMLLLERDKDMSDEHCSAVESSLLSSSPGGG